jgi:hypothetical protein
MTTTQRATVAIKAVADATVQATTTPLPKWVGVAGVALSAIAAIGHDQLVEVFGKWLANFIPVLAAVMAAVSHSLNGTGGKAE